jgi:O-antigen/teichoic acid export membrane protein
MHAMHKPGKNTRSTLLGHSAAIFLIRLAPALASFIALVLLSRYTEADFYGRYQAFWVQWQVLNTIACLGLPTLIFTYPLEKVTGLIRGLKRYEASALLGWMLAIAVVMAMLHYTIGDSLFHPLLAGMFLLISVLVVLAEAYLMLGRKFQAVSIISTLYALYFITAHWLFIRHRLDVRQLFILIVSGATLRLIILIIQAYRQFSSVHTVVNNPLTSIRSLWFHLALYDTVQMLFRWVDKLVLGFILAAPLFARYFNGTIDIPFLPLLLGAAGSALLMQLSTDGVTDEKCVALLKESGCILSRIVFPVFLYLLFFRFELFAVIFRHNYDTAVPLFLIASLVVPLRSYNFTSILQYKGKGRIINAGALLDLGLALVLAYPLYLLFDLNGVALAFVISTWLQALFYLLQTAKMLQISWYELLPLREWMIQLIVFLAVFIVLSYVLHLYFSNEVILFLSAGTLVFIMILALLPVLLKKRKKHYGPDL